MSSPFTSKLGTNYCSQDEEITEIQALLVDPAHRLQRLDDEISEVQKALDKLTEERVRLAAYVDAHRALISPVWRLALDIIQEIFLACLPTHRNCFNLCSWGAYAAHGVPFPSRRCAFGRSSILRSHTSRGMALLHSTSRRKCRSSSPGRLVRLRLAVHVVDLASIINPPPPLRGSETSSFSISAAMAFNPLDMPLHWSRLTKVSVTARGRMMQLITSDVALHLLAGCTALQTCQLEIDAYPGGNGRSFERVIECAFLHTLDLHVTGFPFVAFHQFFGQLSLPALRHLKLSGYCLDEDHILDTPSFFALAPHVETLDIDMQGRFQSPTGKLPRTPSQNEYSNQFRAGVEPALPLQFRPITSCKVQARKAPPPDLASHAGGGSPAAYTGVRVLGADSTKSSTIESGRFEDSKVWSDGLRQYRLSDSESQNQIFVLFWYCAVLLLNNFKEHINSAFQLEAVWMYSFKIPSTRIPPSLHEITERDLVANGRNYNLLQELHNAKGCSWFESEPRPFDVAEKETFCVKETSATCSAVTPTNRIQIWWKSDLVANGIIPALWLHNAKGHSWFEVVPVHLTHPAFGLLYPHQRSQCGPRYGVPILVEDNIATRFEDGMDTTAGSYALLNSFVPGDATVGAAGAGLGAEIDAVIPVSEHQDTIGFHRPIDAHDDRRHYRALCADRPVHYPAIAGKDAADKYTAAQPVSVPDYTAALRKDAHWRPAHRTCVAPSPPLSFFGRDVTYWPPTAVPGVDEFRDALNTMQALGAAIADPADVPSAKDILGNEAGGAYFTTLSAIPTDVHTIADIAAFNDAQMDHEEPLIDAYAEWNLHFDLAPHLQVDVTYKKALATNRELGATRAIDTVLEKDELDALVLPASGFMYQLAGYASITSLSKSLLKPDFMLRQVLINQTSYGYWYISVFAFTAPYASAGSRLAIVSKILFPLALLLLRFNYGRIPRDRNAPLSIIRRVPARRAGGARGDQGGAAARGVLGVRRVSRAAPLHRWVWGPALHGAPEAPARVHPRQEGRVLDEAFPEITIDLVRRSLPASCLGQLTPPLNDRGAGRVCPAAGRSARALPADPTRAHVHEHLAGIFNFLSVNLRRTMMTKPVLLVGAGFRILDDVAFRRVPVP
ncbi:hypothetical protein FB451DRAFT_1448470 [Mycena latifolia]|nr:hypothetical protein FB451DRAFT_1448470 [Mycena latifolia]